MSSDVPRINISTALDASLSPASSAARPPVSLEPGTAPDPLITPPAPPSQHSRVGRIARRPLKLAGSAGSAIKHGILSRRSSSANLAVAAGSSGAGLASAEREARERALAVRGRTRPCEGEGEVARVRVRVVRCEGLVVRDRSGTSDPYVTLSLPPTPPTQTPVIKRSLNPHFPAAGSTFDFPLYASLAESGLYRGRGLEVVVWDKDIVKKDYMGEVAVPLAQWFPEEQGNVLWDPSAGEKDVRAFPLVSAKRRRRVTGRVFLQFGIVLPESTHADGERRAREVVRDLRAKGDRHLASLMGVPAYQGIGTVKIKRTGKRSRRSRVAGGVSKPKTMIASAASALISRAKGRGKSSEASATTPSSEAAAVAPEMSASETDSADDESDEMDEEEDLQDDGLSSESSESEEDEVEEGDDEPLLFESAEETEYLAEDANDRVAPLAKDHARQRRASRRTSNGSYDSSTSASGYRKRPARQGSMNSTSSNDAAMASVGASASGAKTPSSILQDTTGTSSANDSSADLVRPAAGQETSVRIVSPSTASSSPHPSGYFDSVPPPSNSLARRRLFKKSSKDDYGSGTPGGLLTPSGGLESGAATPSSIGGAAPPPARKRRPVFKRGRGKKGTAYTLEHQGHDILGIVMLEIEGAVDLPKLRNSFRFSFDMDPFVVISFGKKVFRTRVIRHSLNPTWDEKMLFHVRRHEDTFSIQFALLDWDKVSGNDFIGSSTIPLADLISDAPKPDEKTGLYGPKEDGKHEMKEFRLPITTLKDAPWETKHSPLLKVRAKYEPYDALRQRFWRQYLTQYDTDDTGTISYTELTTMLDSLGSTLTSGTLHGYFERFRKSYEEDELTYDQVIQCLEDEIHKQRKATERRLSRSTIASGVASPVGYGMAPQPASDGLDYAGPSAAPNPAVDPEELARHIRASAPRRDTDDGELDINVRPTKVENSKGKIGAEQHLAVEGALSPDLSPGESEIDDGLQDSSSPGDTERVVNIKTCPLCHRPRLNKKSEADIITHLAVCASADWSRVDRIVVGNYVTASQAQRKFLSKVLTKLSSGAYSLGANSANIIVQDRATGQLQEEKMAVYVRIGIRVLYKGAKGRMGGARARRLLKSMSVKQGIKYDSPESRLEIPTFIAFHNLNTDQILDPIDSFQTFNQFFYRKLKADARPISDPEDPSRLVSCADCRMMAFETVSEATRIWIKGREFSVARLLGPEYKSVIHKFEGGALGIFRLAPQDYHRFHSPVDGVIGKSTFIDGQYYTVNPQAIRTTLDVYGENVRKIVPIESPQFGTVMTVWVGAMMVGSIGTTAHEGDHVKRGDELGWFAFGGSTIVCLFEAGALQWDDDLLQNGQQSIETLVRMGMGIGRATGQAISLVEG